MAKKIRIPDKVWKHYSTVVQDFIDADAGKQVITWLRNYSQPDEYGEDDEQYEKVQLEALFEYNSFRTWPININHISGETDTENAVMYISSRYLEEAGYLNSEGYWDFDRAKDRFILRGIVYKASGDTDMSQAKDQSLLFMIILRREEPTELSNNNNPPTYG